MVKSVEVALINELSAQIWYHKFIKTKIIEQSLYPQQTCFIMGCDTILMIRALVYIYLSFFLFKGQIYSLNIFVMFATIPLCIIIIKSHTQ